MMPNGVQALNIGLAGFAEPIAAFGATVLNLDWRPPAEADAKLGMLIARLEDDPDDTIGAQVAEANRTALDRLLGASPFLVDIQPAATAIAGLTGRMLLHSGPPIAWERMCGPMRGASARIVMSTLAMMPFRELMRSTAFLRNIEDAAPSHCGSLGGKWLPISPSPNAPSMASVSAWIAAS